MKAILKSVQPQDTFNILNYFATLIINQTAPKEWTDYLRGKSKKKPAPREVYIYCTKFKSKGVYLVNDKCEILSGKVAAKFVLNKVEKIIYREEQKNHYSFGTKTLHPNDLLKRSCLKIEELCQCLGKGEKWLYGEYGYVWHIDNLEIFDKPKELSEFSVRYPKGDVKFKGVRGKMLAMGPLTRAPRSWFYIEV